MSNTIAIIFDFDDTIAPDSTTYFLEEYEISPSDFWEEKFSTRVRQGYDPTIAYLTLLLDQTSPNGEIGPLEPCDLEAVGHEINDEVFDGFAEFVGDINEIVDEFPEIEIEWHIISEGIERIITSSDITELFTSVSASRLGTNENGVIDHIKRPISFTDKTRFLFEINKGIVNSESDENPYLVNSDIPHEDRHVPFKNMIYVGDGLTDVPCFSLVKQRGGRAFSVADEEQPSEKQKAIKVLDAPNRAGHPSKPAYRQSDHLGSLLRLAVEGLCTERSIDTLEAL